MKIVEVAKKLITKIFACWCEVQKCDEGGVESAGIAVESLKSHSIPS